MYSYKESKDNQSKYVLSDTSYGKGYVKILHVVKNGLVHKIKELEVGTSLTLESKKDYLTGDNSDIIATDSQKNTVYILAQKYGIKSLEDFAILLCKHFLSTYRHVVKAQVTIEETPWERISYNELTSNNMKHNHAFINTPTAIRNCKVSQCRNENGPIVITGITNMRVLKTTQSSFINFIDDKYRTLPDMPDRIFSTIIDCSWEYLRNANIDYDKAWNIVKECILKNFGGDIAVGNPSPSVQNTLYLTEKNALELIPAIASIEMTMPNKHYFTYDFSKFQSIVDNSVESVFLPVDKPSGIIYGKLERNNSKL